MTRLSESEDDLLAIDREDDAWFKANPNRTYRLRRAYAIEAGSTKRHAGRASLEDILRHHRADSRAPNSARRPVRLRDDRL